MTVGVVYSAMGQKFNTDRNTLPGKRSILEEAVASARSVRKTNPQLETCIWTDTPTDEFTYCRDIRELAGDDFWQEYERTRSHTWRFLLLAGLKLRAVVEAPFDDVLWLDSDTYVLQDIAELWDRQFDIALSKEYPAEHVFNAGVMACRGAGGKQFFRDWWRMFRSGHYQSEQGVFPKTLEYNRCSLNLLNWQVWNVRPKNADGAQLPKSERKHVKILHSRYHVPVDTDEVLTAYENPTKSKEIG